MSLIYWCADLIHFILYFLDPFLWLLEFLLNDCYFFFSVFYFFFIFKWLLDIFLIFFLKTSHFIVITKQSGFSTGNSILITLNFPFMIRFFFHQCRDFSINWRNFLFFFLQALLKYFDLFILKIIITCSLVDFGKVSVCYNRQWKLFAGKDRFLKLKSSFFLFELLGCELVSWV